MDLFLPCNLTEVEANERTVVVRIADLAVMKQNIYINC